MFASKFWRLSADANPESGKWWLGASPSLPAAPGWVTAVLPTGRCHPSIPTRLFVQAVLASGLLCPYNATALQSISRHPMQMHVLHLLQAASLVPPRLLGCFWLFSSLEVASRQKNTNVPISLKFLDRGTRSSCSQPHRALSLSCSSKIQRANTKPCSSCSRNGNFPFPYFQCHVGK